MQQAPVNFPLLLKQLEDKMYQKALFEEFLKKVSIEMILTKYKAGVKGTKRLIEKILQDYDHYQKILFNKVEKEQKLIAELFVKDDFRLLLADTIDTNFRDVAKELNSLQKENIEVFQNQLNIFFSFMNEPAGEIGLKVLKGLVKMLQKQLLQCLTDDFFYEHILIGMKNENDEVRMRFMEISMEISNTGEEAHIKLIDKGILDLCIQQIVTQDILLRLAAVEVISKIGNREYNSKFLAEHPLMKTIIFDAFNPLEELYVKKYLALLISKLVANKTLEFTLQLRQQFLDLITLLLFKGMEEEKYAAVDIISQLARTQDGINLILLRKEVFTEYMKLSQVTKQTLKIRFISSFKTFFSKQDDPQKLNKVINNIMICYGNVAKIDSILDFKQAAPSLDDLQPSIELLFTYLYQPFPEQELEVLNLVSIICEWELLCKYFIGHKKALHYLTQHHAKNSEIFIAKQDFIEQLKNLCKNVFNKENLVFKEFAEKLEQTIADIKSGKLSGKDNKPEEMEYAENVQ